MDLMQRRRQIMMGASPLIEMTATGNPAAFTAKVSKVLTGLTIPFTPVQDLHGYDHPWPAGGGKNLCIHYVDRQSNQGITYTPSLDGIEIKGTATNASYSWDNTRAGFENSLIKLSAGTYTFSSNASPGDSQAQGYIVFLGQTESGTDINSIVFNATILKRTVTFSENVGIYYGIYVASGMTVNLTVKLQIESGSSATDWAPYSNICPITGFTGANVTRTGANVFDGECESGYINVTTGQPDSNDNRYRTKNYISVLPDTTYYAKWSAHQTANNVVSRIFYYDANKDYISASGSVYTNGTFTTPSNAWFAKFFVNEAFSNYGNDISINYPATATTYEPYTGTTIPVTFPALGKNLIDAASGERNAQNWWVGADRGASEPNGSFVLSAGTYTLSVSDAMSGLYVRKNGTAIKTVYNNTQLTFSLAEKTAIKIMLYKTNITVDYWDTIDIQLELGSTATDYEPYTNTAYSGTLDAVTGVLTVDRASVDMGTLIFYKSSAVSSVEGSVFSIPLENIGNGVKPRQRYAPNMVLSEAFMPCNADVWWVNQMPDNSINVGETALLIACSKYDNAESFKAAMSGVQLIYELATPLTFQLDPVTLTALKGNNVLWTDTNGTNTVKYLTRN